MLQHDYLMEIIAQFVEMVAMALRRALAKHDIGAAQEAEAAVAELLDLDPSVALGLAPDSLVTMMLLSGMAESVADYVAFTLDRLGDTYDAVGNGDLADLRYAQAQAVAESFGCDLDAIPEGFEDIAELEA